MSKTIYVDCPLCEGLLEIDPESGEVVNKWSASDRNASGADKMTAALKKIEEARRSRKDLFDRKRVEMEDKKRRLEDEFRKNVEKAKNDGAGDKKPISPFDLD